MPIVKVTKQQAEAYNKSRNWMASDTLTDEEIARQIAENPDAAPELTDDWFNRAAQMEGPKVTRRGRPKAAVTKKLVSLRLDRDIIEKFQSTGRGWQSRINDALRWHLQK